MTPTSSQTPSGTLNNAPDLRTGFPRSPNASLGPYILLPRIIDKCRAVIAETNGEYKFNCPLDQRFFSFTGVDADAFKAQAAQGASDADLLDWVKKQARPHTEDEIAAWTYRERWRRPETEEQVGFFESVRLQAVPENYRVETWFQLLDAEEGRG